MLTQNTQCNLEKREIRLVVGGKECPSGSVRGIERFNPFNGQKLGDVPEGIAHDADLAVAAARGAFESGCWSGAAPAERKAVLHRFADLISRDADQLDLVDAMEMGKPISTGRFNARAAADHMRFYAEATDKISGDVVQTDRASLYVLRQVPRGVVAAITPWNFPTYNAVMKIAPALAAGNCLVLKPSELSTYSALHLMSLALEAGVPEGVVNLVPGSGATVGKALARHSDVDMVAFTGSTRVGGMIQELAGQSNLKVVQAECGGKSPQVVFDDGINTKAAADFIATFLLTNQGQVCSAGTRLLVQRSIADEMLELVKARFELIRPGNPALPSTDFGPLVSRQQTDRVMQYVNEAKSAGLRILTGAKRILEDTGGNFVAPTLIADVPVDAPVAQDEIFGPVLVASTFDTIDDAVRMANGTRYGLTCYAWTANLGTAMHLAETIRSPVMIRQGASAGTGAGHASTTEPWGMSGIGPEGGLAGLAGYMRCRAVGIFH